MDNQVSFVVVPLATNVADPAERIREIGKHTLAAKELQEVLREHPVGSFGDAAPPFLIGGLLRAAYVSHLLSYFPGMLNTLVSNVPGPPIPLYMAGARLCGIFPTSVILEGMGLNITVFTFEDRVDFGLHVDPNLVPDPWEVSAGIPLALAELMECAGLDRSDAGLGSVRSSGERVVGAAAINSSRLARRSPVRSQRSGACSRHDITAIVISPA